MLGHSLHFSNLPDPTFYKQLNQYSQIAVLVDENTERHCYPLVSAQLPEHLLIRITSGETNKNLNTCQLIWNALTEARFDRKAAVINLGGGVIGDMGGFCAATYKRGIDFFQLPTTLLSQVDASVGGKLGIDYDTLKNHIGVFENPVSVLVCREFLNTLSPRLIKSGFAEMLKHGLIADEQHWENASLQSWQNPDLALIEASVRIKERVVVSDPKEKGLRKILNFGHTIGHAVESHFLEQSDVDLLHGEAVALGMICEAWLSTEVCGLSKSAFDKISQQLLTIYDLPKLNPADFDLYLSMMTQDKKNEGGVVQFSLLEAIGRANYNQICGKELVLKSLEVYQSLIG